MKKNYDSIQQGHLGNKDEQMSSITLNELRHQAMLQ
jgi:hypothetical protein